MNFMKFLLGTFLLRDEFNPEKDGGDPVKVAAYFKSQNEKTSALQKELEALKAKPAPANEPDDLATKAAREREENDKKAKHESSLESAISFISGSKEWSKSNKSLLPKNIDSILDQAEKENYSSKIAKANSIKDAIILEFFGEQANLDLLTASQKVSFEDFKKLTKDKRVENAQNFFDTIFEPTFETLKKVKRAEQVSKGFADQSQGEQNYKNNRVKLARKQHLGEK